MNALSALKAARAAGVQVQVDGADLVLSASAQPPDNILDDLTRNKGAILDILRQETEGWDTNDWLVFFYERAGIIEFDGGAQRRDAEDLAFEACMVEWCHQHPVRSDPDRCNWCGQLAKNRRPVIPFGTNDHGHTWLHPDCWRSWYNHRQDTARQALLTMGLPDVEVAERGPSHDA
jgi:hypothetical protein